MLTLVFHDALILAVICCDPYLPWHRLVLQEDDLAVATVSLWSSLAPGAGHCGSPLHAIHALLQGPCGVLSLCGCGLCTMCYPVMVFNSVMSLHLEAAGAQAHSL